MGPNFPIKMTWERLILVLGGNNFQTQGVPATGDWASDDYSDDDHLCEKESPPDASSQKASREG